MWLLDSGGGRWDHPQPIRYFLQDDEERELAKKYINHLLSGLRSVEYLGLKKYIRYQSVFRLPTPWGWKDPRNTFLLPLWMELFPDAKVVHIHRHGVDVARSLRARRQKQLKQYKHAWARRKLLYQLLLKQRGVSGSPRCATLKGGFTLWEKYMEEASKHLSRYSERSIDIRYESLLNKPELEIERLAQFLGTSPQNSKIDRIRNSISPDRAFAYKEDAESCRFAIEVRERLEKYGYSIA
jgi:hypothetical protein